MSQSAEEMLVALESLLNEFNHSTSNGRKKEIELILNSFSEQNNSWNNCLKFLKITKNQYTSMFCLSVLESFVLKRWVGIGSQEKAQVRHFLWSYYLEGSSYWPPFIINKTAKLIVIIGRVDWPDLYPSFFTDIYVLLQAKETTLLGIILLGNCNR